jgi:hypothetical protein
MERRLGALDNGQDLPRAYSRLIDYQANLAELRRLFSTGILHKKERQPMDVPFLDRYHDYLRQDTEKKTLAALQLQSWPPMSRNALESETCSKRKSKVCELL